MHVAERKTVPLFVRAGGVFKIVVTEQNFIVGFHFDDNTPHPGGVAWECALLLSPGIRVCSHRQTTSLSRTNVQRLFFPSAIYRPRTYEGGRVIIQLTWDGVTQ
jgi:hypothetical protein